MHKYAGFLACIEEPLLTPEAGGQITSSPRDTSCGDEVLVRLLAANGNIAKGAGEAVVGGSSYGEP
jgi:hypothetical protein